MRTKITMMALALCLVASANAADPAWYQKKATYDQTLRASIVTLETYLASAPGPIVVGPMMQTKPFPAKSIKDKLAFDKTIKKISLNDASVWSKCDHPADKTAKFDQPAGTVQYFACEITAPKALSKQQIYFRSSEGHELWLANRRYITEEPSGKKSFNRRKVNVNFEKGKSLLVMKVYNRAGKGDLYFSIAANGKRDWARGLQSQLFDLVQRDFAKDGEAMKHLAWELADGIWKRRVETDKDMKNSYASPIRIASLQAKAKAGDLATARTCYHTYKTRVANLATLATLDTAGLKKAIETLEAKYGDAYKGEDYLKTLAAFGDLATLKTKIAEGDQAALAVANKLIALQRQALVTGNPLFDFDEILYVKHAGESTFLFPNWMGAFNMPRTGQDSSVRRLNFRTGKEVEVLHAAGTDAISDVDLDFNANRIVYGSPDEKGQWQIWEHTFDGAKTRMINTGDHDGIHNFDPCILPNGKVIFMSTRAYVGVPCISGKKPSGVMYVTDSDGTNIRQISFDQDSSWYPTVMENGKIMYTRWEYTDNSHYYTRILMTMNPDGSSQMNYYGSNGYFPNSMFYTRPLPGSSSKFVTIASGHHGTWRSGRMLLFDTAHGRKEAEGFYGEIGEHSEKMKAPIRDKLVDRVPVHFINPMPLDENFFLAARLDRTVSDSKWEICMVDTFKNVVPLISIPGAQAVEPIPFRATKRPPIIPSKINLAKKTGTVHLVDIYRGPGLKGVPVGTVKKLRVFAWHYTYLNMGGHQAISVEGGWEPKIMLGTVPVEKDGSAFFQLPAITPIAVQPLDEQGQALQIMRSWFVLQPGENMACVGCHEDPNETPPAKRTIALMRRPSILSTWKGPRRTISFKRDVQVVLDKNCIGCHNDKTPDRPNFLATPAKKPSWGGKYTPSYLALHPYTRRPGPESDMAMLFPLEYHSSTSELVQMLRKGHHGVKMDADSWDRLVTWIDLNVPDHGTWGEIAGGKAKVMAEKRQKMADLYAPVHTDIKPEAILTEAQVVDFIQPAKPAAAPKSLTLKGWPLTATQAKAQAGKTDMTLDLGDGVKVTLVKIPAGKFVMGDVKGFADEWPQAAVTIDKAYWMGKFEITNAQYAKFDPKHDSIYIDQQWKDHTTRGYPANRPNQPVIRISWTQAMKYCQWLSKKTGKKVTLPTEAQWEYAARAGSATPFWYGGLDTDFGKLENLADAKIQDLTVKGINPQPYPNPSPRENFVPREGRFNDGQLISCEVGKYQANPWGLHDMHGNVSEWTRSSYTAYPYKADDGRNNLDPADHKVMRGGSWRSRPKWSRSSVRIDYRSYQPVYNGGFRIIVEE